MSAVTVDEINEFLRRDFGGSANSCESVGDGWAIAVFSVLETNLRPGGIVSGPTVFGVCDAALYYACFTKIGISPMTMTSELSIRYLRPARGATVQIGRASGKGKGKC